MILIALVVGMLLGVSASTIYFRKQLDLDQTCMKQATEALTWSNQTIKQYREAERLLREVVYTEPASPPSGWLN